MGWEGRECCPRLFTCRCEGCGGQGRVTPTVSADGTAGWPDCKVRAGPQRADPLRPALTAYLRLPAQLPAYALGVQAAPQQQRQYAEQQADPRGHVAAAPARGTRRGAAGRRSAAPRSRRTLQRCPGPVPRGKSQGLACFPAPSAGRFLRSASSRAGFEVVQPCSVCPRIRARVPDLEAREWGRRGGTPALRPHPPGSPSGTRRCVNRRLFRRRRGLAPRGSGSLCGEQGRKRLLALVAT